MSTGTVSRRGLFTGAASVGAASFAGGLVGLPKMVRAEAHAAFDATAYDRMVGDIRVTAVLDGVFGLDQGLITGMDPAAVGENLSRAYLDPKAPVPLAISAHVLRAGDQVTLVDSGAGAAFGPGSGRLLRSLEALGIAADSVTRIILTHMHPDHIGGLMGEAGAVFGKATLHVSSTDFKFWTDEAIAASVPESSQPFFALARAVAGAYGERVMPFDGDADLGGGVTAMALPGHTPGHTGYRVASGADQLVIWGDAAAIAALQFSHPDTGIAFDADGAMAAATRRKLLEMAAADRIAVAGTHLPFPGFGHVEARDGAFAFVPEEWKIL